VPDVVDRPELNRFELQVDGHVAELVYRPEGNSLILVHTEVPEEVGGRGIGGRLVLAAVRRASRDGLTLVPLCPFARRWLRKHPEAIGEVAIDWDSRQV
jgi:predicted GNAT family acetyltransferase